ncbi:nucleoid-associated protein [Streptomyces lunaelactis]|uniref:nucleoid-associated protein n=1 Tax=Streptomyces lunaelactis TaxID=1535768 RepID=UPI00158542E3|nr:nucleoid-associated protein [Streptomyces lunaelactis]NUK14062.1 nucleoid-associated protein [Streptomyces lunaelactis]
MREIDKVSVDRAILHMVSPDGSGLEMSDRDIPLDRALNFSDFLARHVLNGLHDSQTRTARFTPPGNGIGKLCEDLVLSHADLVATSKRIAKALQDAIGADKRVTPGALVVALCASQATPFLALMKLDPGDVFTPAWYEDKGGRYLAPRRRKNALPTVHQRLQKCAFVNPAAPPTDRERLLVLDRQVHGMPATFFLEGFLQAEPEYGPARQTVDFHAAVWRARSKIEAELSPRRLIKLDAAIDGVFAHESVDIGEWVKRLPSMERAAIEAEIGRKQLDREIVFDQQVLENKYSKVRYECDNGVIVQADKFAFETTVQRHPLSDVEGGPRLRIVIETRQWTKREG